MPSCPEWTSLSTVVRAWPSSAGPARARVRCSASSVSSTGPTVGATCCTATTSAGYPNADLYQLLAYCTVLGLRSGHLVYAKGNEGAARHVVRRSGIEIFCHAVDLDQKPEGLLARMSDLAERIAATRLQPSTL